MVPGTRRNRVQLRLGMAGVRIPCHVGTWRVEDATPAISPSGEAVAVFTVRHERLESAPRMLVDATGAVIFAKLTVDWQSQMEQKGWQF